MNEIEKAVKYYIDKIPNEDELDTYLNESRKAVDVKMDKAHKFIDVGMKMVRNEANVYKENPEKISNEICTVKDIVCTKDIMYHLYDNYNKVCLDKDNDALACKHLKTVIKQFDNKCNVLVDVCKYPDESSNNSQQSCITVVNGTTSTLTNCSFHNTTYTNLTIYDCRETGTCTISTDGVRERLRYCQVDGDTNTLECDGYSFTGLSSEQIQHLQQSLFNNSA